LTQTFSPILRDAGPDDFDAICALNAAEVQHTSAMDLNQLRDLDALSSYHKVALSDGVVSAFLLAITDGAPYRNDNYEWFARRYPKFLYIDRVVVASARRGLRLGSMLYEDLFGYARAHGIPRIACEYNIVPPNEPSRLFHDKFGFEQQGTQWLGDGAKQVALQIAKT
jgi:predicted GNAT superfamily acetyltransferase